MYLIVIHVPVYISDNRTYVTTEWKRSLLLLHNSLKNHFDSFALLAPSIPLEDKNPEQVLEEISETDGIRIISGGDTRGSSKKYWFQQRTYWKNQVIQWVSCCEVVHAGIDQLWKPIMFEGFLEGYRKKKTTIFVVDTDVILQLQQLSPILPLLSRIKNSIYCFFLERAIRWSVKRADLSLLKGKELIRRYGRYAKNAKDFHDTSYTTEEVISLEVLNQRLDSFSKRRDLKLVYAGRFEKRKGLKESLHLVAHALQKGADIKFDLIGSGEEEDDLQKYADSLSLRSHVQFLGRINYGPKLLSTLAQYDALLFTPLAEDTPRMIFDGFAAGLPLISYPIKYSKEVIWESQAGILIENFHDLYQIYRQKEDLIPISYHARYMALANAADVWYRKRAEWTLEAMIKS